MAGWWADKPVVFRIGMTFRTASRSIMRQKLRSILSVLGVVCGVTAVFTMICISEGAKREAVRQIEAMGANNIVVKAKDLTAEQKSEAISKLSRGLSVHDAQRIHQALPSVSKVAISRNVRAAVKGAAKDVTPEILAVSASYHSVMSIGLNRGRFFNGQEQMEKRLVCVLGQSVAQSLGPGGAVGQLLRIENLEFAIVGVLLALDEKTASSLPSSARNLNQAVLIPLETDKSIIPGGDGRNFQGVELADNTDEVSEFVVQISRADIVTQSAKVVRRLLDLYHNGADDYSVIVPIEILAQSRQTQRTFNIILGSIAGISLLAGGIGIMNIMLAVIYERRREIGIRRAVGANQRHILAHFLSESVLLTAAGGVAGIIIGLIFVMAISLFSGWETVIAIWAVGLSLGMAAALGAVFGCYPAYIAATTDPIEALRGPG